MLLYKGVLGRQKAVRRPGGYYPPGRELASSKPVGYVRKDYNLTNTACSHNRKTQTKSGRWTEIASRKPRKVSENKVSADGKSELFGTLAAKELNAPKKAYKPYRLIYQKLELGLAPWNLKRGARLRKLKLSIQKVREGRNPFYKWKDILANVKISNVETYNRYKAVLEGGFLFTRRSIGDWVEPQIRIIKRLSFHMMETLISKLPFWATSYSIATMYDVVRITKLVM